MSYTKQQKTCECGEKYLGGSNSYLCYDCKAEKKRISASKWENKNNGSKGCKHERTDCGYTASQYRCDLCDEWVSENDFMKVNRKKK